MTWKRFCEINMILPSFYSCSIENLKQFKQEAKHFLLNPFSMILVGDSGRGKTYFILALIRELLEVRKIPLGEMRYINALELEERVDECMEQFRSSRYFIEGLCSIYFLFIDDFGIEGTIQRAERNYYSLTDKRLGGNKPTVFSTNLTDEEILETYGMRIDSRLKRCKRLNFNGPDLRELTPERTYD